MRSRQAAPEQLGERLKRLRTEAGLSQRALAGPGVGYAYISRIEAGTRTPSAKALQELAAKLDISALYLATGHQHGRRPFCGRDT
jgi:transcriptional regulator with XRE-family HTH domain